MNVVESYSTEMLASQKQSTQSLLVVKPVNMVDLKQGMANKKQQNIYQTHDQRSNPYGIGVEVGDLIDDLSSMNTVSFVADDDLPGVESY